MEISWQKEKVASARSIIFSQWVVTNHATYVYILSYIFQKVKSQNKKVSGGSQEYFSALSDKNDHLLLICYHNIF